ACTEMIMLTGGDNKDSIFEESEEDYDARARYCKEAYGVDPRPNWITTEFGGHKIGLVLKRFASNIIFFNGLRDPWSGGGYDLYPFAIQTSLSVEKIFITFCICICFH
ncbi:hypothetical protein CISIN_1g0106562mg, partial [Citrus sinensis]